MSMRDLPCVDHFSGLTDKTDRLLISETKTVKLISFLSLLLENLQLVVSFENQGLKRDDSDSNNGS